jgi:hypothetical protein
MGVYDIIRSGAAGTTVAGEVNPAGSYSYIGNFVFNHEKGLISRGKPCLQWLAGQRGQITDSRPAPVGSG